MNVADLLQLITDFLKKHPFIRISINVLLGLTIVEKGMQIGEELGRLFYYLTHP